MVDPNIVKASHLFCCSSLILFHCSFIRKYSSTRARLLVSRTWDIQSIFVICCYFKQYIYLCWLMPLIVSKKELPDLQSNIRFTNDERNMMIVYCNCLPLVGYFPQRLPWRPSPKAVAPRSPTKITKKIFILHWDRSVTWPSLSMCSSQSSWQRGGVLATWFSFI